MSILDYLIHGDLAIHQEFINKFIKESIAENKFVSELEVSISEGLINAVADIRAGDDTTVHIKLEMSLGDFVFNRLNRYLELNVPGPVLISVYGVTIRAKLEAEFDHELGQRYGAPEGLISLFQFLSIKEDKIILDFNKIPGFNQALHKKLGFILKNLEVNKLELLDKKIIIRPTIKFF